MAVMSIIGCGLIGGSMALSWRRAGLVNRVVGYDHRQSNIDAAIELKVVDEGFTTIGEAVKDADIIVVSVPVLAMEEVFAEVARNMRPDAIVTDVGSTRQTVIAMARRGLGDKFRRYGPGHPIAGGEMPGVRYASADLFDDKKIISTPTEDMDPEVVRFMEDGWTKAGGIVQSMSPEEHDGIFAAVSHLPHVLAYALVDMIARSSNADEKLHMAGAGFRDFTRIASSSPVMWRDICLTNREALSKELRTYRQELAMLQEAIDNGEADKMEKCFENAMKNRRGLVFAGSKPGK